MVTADIKQKIFQLAKKAADDQGVEIFDIEFLGKDKLLLRIFIDKEEGITIDDCEKISKYLGAILDVEDPFPGPYTLEVSSPGLDRPLRSIKDFEKNTGKLARIITGEKVENQNFFIGRIVNVNGNFINLLVNKRELAIPYEKIVKAKLEVEL
jgi:ribosome maturation factor RimP